MKWLRRVRDNIVRDVARETVRQMAAGGGWREFLPPVVLRDCVYMVTKDGCVYRMHWDSGSQMEQITQIRAGGR